MRAKLLQQAEVRGSLLNALAAAAPPQVAESGIASLATAQLDRDPRRFQKLSASMHRTQRFYKKCFSVRHL